MFKQKNCYKFVKTIYSVHKRITQFTHAFKSKKTNYSCYRVDVNGVYYLPKKLFRHFNHDRGFCNYTTNQFIYFSRNTLASSVYPSQFSVGLDHR